MMRYSIEAIKNGVTKYVQKDVFFYFVTNDAEKSFTNYLDGAVAVCRFLMKPWCLYETQDVLTVRDDTGRKYFSIDRYRHETLYNQEVALCACGCGQPVENEIKGRKKKFVSNACKQRFYRRKVK